MDGIRQPGERGLLMTVESAPVPFHERRVQMLRTYGLIFLLLGLGIGLFSVSASNDEQSQGTTTVTGGQAEAGPQVDPIG